AITTLWILVNIAPPFIWETVFVFWQYDDRVGILYVSYFGYIRTHARGLSITTKSPKPAIYS
ncbi:hypothetical protein ACFLWI_03215, partial [Chloroflexota bacterium]